MNEQSAGRSVDIENKARSLCYLSATTDALRDTNMSVESPRYSSAKQFKT